MTTETTTTNNLPPCPLPDCKGGAHHYHDIEVCAVGDPHDCAEVASVGYRCYGPHQPQQQWRPIEIDEIKPGMRLRATTVYDDCVITRTGVARHSKCDWFWYTENGRLLVGWADQLTCEVDPATVSDPDAELIEKLAGLLDLTDWEDAREVIAAVRAHDEEVTGDE